MKPRLQAIYDPALHDHDISGTTMNTQLQTRSGLRSAPAKNTDAAQPDEMRRSRRILLAASTLIAVAAAMLAPRPALAAPWAARNGLTGAQYQQAFDDYSKQGFRLVSVSGYESGGGARYAALWRKQAGPAWVARHGLTPQQYQAAFDDLGKQGFRLRFVNGYAVGGAARYAAIWEKSSGPAMQARHGLTAPQYQAAVDDLSKQRYGLSHVTAFDLGGSPRFAAIFEKGGPAWGARHGLSASQYQQAFEDFAKQGYRLKVVSGYRQNGDDRYAAVWVKQNGPQWSARHGIPGGHYQHVFDNYLYQSWEPRYIEAFNSSSGVRFNGVWENTTFQSQDLDLIGKKVRAYMQKNDIPGMSIAIMKNEKLVYAAGFGKADTGTGEPVSPKHRFRVASVSKPITHVAIMRLIQDTNLETGSDVFGSGSVLGGTYATPSNNNKIEDITIDHLIRHRSGFVNVNANGDSSDPMFAYTGTDHKGLIEWTLKNYPLGFDPGADSKYSNFGYCLLGRVIEVKSGKSYETYVREKILIPAGAGGIVIGGDKEADRKPNEVKYYGSGAYSSVKPVRFDSHGGWIATPIDLLRFMKHESVLGTPYSHYGEMSGTMSVFRRRSDGFGYAANINKSNDTTGDIDTMMKEIVEGVSQWPTINLF
jgi:CubicO group peptidase (beta-lactamase class C family)